MEWAMAYFDGAEDVSKKKRGWDIEAPSQNGVALIEVKGLSGTRLAIELTPNEYGQMLKRKHEFVLFVLTAALSRKPRARIFRYQPGATASQAPAWVSDHGERLKIAERLGACCTL